MKKALTLIAICFLNTFLLAQSDALQFGISINPTYSYRYLYSDVEGLKKTLDNLESGKISFSAGGFIEKKIGTRARFQVGMNLMNWGSIINKKGLSNWGSQNQNGSFDPTILTNEPGGISAISFTFNSWNIELPVDFKYFMNKKQSFYFSTGISPLYNLGYYTTTKTTLSDGSTKRNVGKTNSPSSQKLLFAAQLGVGYEWKIRKNLTFYLQPQWQILFKDLANLSSKSGTIPYNLGIQMGSKF